LIDDILKAKYPKNVFGDISSHEELKAKFNEIAKKIHPDVCDDKDAPDAMMQLIDLKNTAHTLIDSGNYDKNYVRFYSKKDIFLLEERPFAFNPSAHHYRGISDSGKKVIAHASRMPGKKLVKEDYGYAEKTQTGPYAMNQFTPLDFFKWKNKVIAIYEDVPGFYSIEELKKYFPDGIDDANLMWIWRHCLDYANYLAAEYHILVDFAPENIFVGTGDLHEIKISSLCQEVQNPIRDLSYNTRRSVMSIADSMMYIGNKKKMHPKIKGHLKYSQLEKSGPPDAITLYRELEDVIYEVFGEKKYVELNLP
jgi:hypothetical protein